MSRLRRLAEDRTKLDSLLDKHWGINVDVKYLWLQPTFSASVNDGAIPLTGKAKLDPWIYGGGITYKF